MDDVRATSSKATFELPMLPLTRRSANTVKRPLLLALCAVVATLSLHAYILYVTTISRDAPARVHRVPADARSILRQCAGLRAMPGPPEDFHARVHSDRFESGTRPTLIKNARVWTGAKNGTETLDGDVLLSGGVVKGVGNIPEALLRDLTGLVVVDADGAWVTPGLGAFQLSPRLPASAHAETILVDFHSHVGILSAPVLSGAFELNSFHGPILPWLRSIDAFNTHDEAFALTIAGGVTSVQVLPGSANAIGTNIIILVLLGL
jgi:hypothetical protein